MPRPKNVTTLRAHALEVVTQICSSMSYRATPPSPRSKNPIQAALAGLRRDLLAQHVQRQVLADLRRTIERPKRPVCGATPQAVGQQVRQVVTHGEVLAPIERKSLNAFLTRLACAALVSAWWLRRATTAPLPRIADVGWPGAIREPI